MRVRLAPTVLLISLAFAGVAYAAADLQRGEAALKRAYEQTEGDDAGYEGTLVEQCRVESETVVRCVVVSGSGHSVDRPEEGYHERRKPIDFGVATFGSDDQITTSREPFAEVPKDLDADIRIARRLRRDEDGRFVIRVAPDVASRVAVRGWFGSREISERRPTPLREVEVPGGRTTEVSLKLDRRQRGAIRRALRRRGTIRSLVSVRVVGDVGPADASELVLGEVDVVRRARRR